MHHDLDHARHDLDLIAGLAADDLTTTEQLRARAQAHACGECSALRDDLMALTTATRALPAQPAPRDFRITAEQAARLRRTSWAARLLGPFASTGSIARPLAATFTTLGLVGVFVAAAVPGLLGAGAPSLAPESAAGNPGVTSASSAPDAVRGPAVGTAATVEPPVGAKDNAQASDAPAYVQAGGGNTGSTGGSGGGSTGASTTGSTDGSTADTRDLGRVADTHSVNLLLWGSITVLGVGLMLFALRFAGRRIR